MALNADDKKIFRKYLTDQAQRAKAKANANYQAKRTLLVNNAAEQKPSAKAQKDFDKLLAAATAYNDLLKTFDADPIHKVSRANHYSGGVYKIDATELRIGFKTYDAATVKALQALDSTLERTLTAIDDETSRAQLTIIAQDAPGIEKQLKALADRFTALVDGI